MQSQLKSNHKDPQRRVLAGVLALIALVLVLGGVRLMTLGGSTYYLLAGLAMAACAYGAACGDSRARWLYGGLIGATGIWALCESGVKIWGLEVRLFTPLCMGIWVFWPSLRRWPRTSGAIAIIAFGAVIWLMLRGADPIAKPASPGPAFKSAGQDWSHYGNDLGGKRYSSLGQIAPDNVAQLKEVWRIHTTAMMGAGFESTPLFVNNTLYLCTPNNIVMALDPDTGERRWTFDPKGKIPQVTFCRGVAYYAVPNANGPCAQRIIFSTVDARLMEVDAGDGRLCSDFGDGGSVDLSRGLGHYIKGWWRTTSAPEVVRGNILLNAFIADGQYVGEPSGVIRAFDAVTGRLAWAWDMDHPERHGEPPPGDIYSPGTPNSWGPISGDEELGLVYLPMGNSTPDYWGAHRSPASEKYASSVVALDATTGEVRWSFQTAHHDLWDYDIAAQPTLVDLPINGKTTPALIAATKRGEIFLLDRRDGTALARIEERSAPQGAAAGDFVAPTQPFSTGMPSFDDTRLSERTMWGLTPLDQLWCRIKFREARYDGPMTPPGVKPSITYPGFGGGVEWGGVSVDPERQLMVVNWNRLANYTHLIPRAQANAMGVRLPTDGLLQGPGQPLPQMGTPFAVLPNIFWSPLKVPCTEPPYGKITVVDLVQRKKVWERSLGTGSESGPLGVPSHLPIPLGVPNIGGALTTKSGLIFIGATQDLEFRAFDIRDGRKLWSAPLPAGGNATPMTFVSASTGRQYVVIAAGGNYSILSKMGDYVVAYALPPEFK